MTNDRACANTPALPKTRQEIEEMAIRLTCILQGATVLIDTAFRPTEDREREFARNALVPLIEDAARDAGRLANALDQTNFQPA